MSQISYEGAPVPVREDIPQAEGRSWERLASPGNWWTGAERVAIAGEVRKARECALCAERKQASSPEAVQGHHDSPGVLPEAAVDVVHRVVTDSSQLSKSWFERTLASGLSDAQYVEIVGVVVAVVSIDSFCRALGVPLHPLPEPEPGGPSRYRPPGAALEGAWVPMIQPGKLSEREADLYPGRTGNVIRALSLVPDAVRMLKDLSAAHYLPVADVGNPGVGRALDRSQMELLAGRVSALNECFY